MKVCSNSCSSLVSLCTIFQNIRCISQLMQISLVNQGAETSSVKARTGHTIQIFCPIIWMLMKWWWQEWKDYWCWFHCIFHTVCLRQCYKNKPRETACEGKNPNEKGQVRMATSVLADRNKEVGEREKNFHVCHVVANVSRQKLWLYPNAVYANFILNGLSILSFC